ncbi:DUF1572 family protein [Rummeliibacillus pycnus]|uniref:DUF1572 family protein n=1 Tax=Rummeliibacillus pycnus TaxID=101070 RepID=UPI000C99B8FD|nr:DUF1572 family protein [Rummeliibacillus pycnus]
MIEKLFKESILARFADIKKQGDGTIAQLSIEEMQWIPNAESNSIAILIKHICGNILSRSTDFLTTDGEKSSRNRDDEFIDNSSSKEQLLVSWENAWTLLFETIEQLSPEDLGKNVLLKGKELSVIEALHKQLAHYATHVGQIMYIGKQIKKDQWKTLSIPKKA